MDIESSFSEDLEMVMVIFQLAACEIYWMVNIDFEDMESTILGKLKNHSLIHDWKGHERFEFHLCWGIEYTLYNT